MYWSTSKAPYISGNTESFDRSTLQVNTMCCGATKLYLITTTLNLYCTSCTVYDVQCTACTVRCTMYGVQCTVYAVQGICYKCIPYNVIRTMKDIHTVLYSMWYK